MERRRAILALLGAAACPGIARAQPRDRVRRIGLLSGFGESELRPLLGAFRERLALLGHVENRDVFIDAAASDGDFARMAAQAARIVDAAPDVIVAQGSPGVAAVRRHSATVPIVFVLVADPVRLGLIDSLARPGGFSTGFTNFEFAIGGKWLELLTEIAPALARVTVLASAGNPSTDPFVRSVESAARVRAIAVATAAARHRADIAQAVEAASDRPGGGLIVLPDSLTAVNRDLIVEHAARRGLPAVYPFRIFAAAGGLLSYGLDYPGLFRDAAGYVDRILRGARAADLPVQAPTRLELVINLRAARALGLVVPLTMQAAADEVID